MYLNLPLIHEKGYNLQEVNILQILKQNRTEDNEDFLARYYNDEILEKFEQRSLSTSVKKKRKNDSLFKVMRLTKKGEELLDLFETPEITPGDEDMFNYLCEMYLNNEDNEREIGNKKKTREYCAVFRQKVGIGLHEMFYLCKAFLEEYKFTKRLEYIFFNSNKNRYGTFKNNVEDSPLFQYFENNQDYLEELWNVKIKPEDRKK